MTIGDKVYLRKYPNLGEGYIVKICQRKIYDHKPILFFFVYFKGGLYLECQEKDLIKKYGA